MHKEPESSKNITEEEQINDVDRGSVITTTAQSKVNEESEPFRYDGEASNRNSEPNKNYIEDEPIYDDENERKLFDKPYLRNKYRYETSKHDSKNDSDIRDGKIRTYEENEDRPAIKLLKEGKATDDNSRKWYDKSYRRKFVTRTPKTSTTTEYSPMEDPDFDVDKNYFYHVSRDDFIKNRYVKVFLDGKNQVSRVRLSNGVEIALTINMYYYASDDPDRMFRPSEKKPGPNVFKNMDPEPVLIREYFQCVVHKTYIVEELQCTFSSWAAFVLRIYYERPVIELDWVVGPIPTTDNIGKDVFIRYSTDLASKGQFYTDSNGRQTLKRVRNNRPTYQPMLSNIPSNYYPVTSKIHIEDLKKNIRFSVLNDRAQGGTSLHDGEIDLMLHRRILTDDNGIRAWLNETEDGKGIIVRGKHHLYIAKANHIPNKIFEKKLAKEIELAPQVFAGPRHVYGYNSKPKWHKEVNEFKGVVKRLPAGIHVLTLQEWNDNKLLLRLENYLEKSDISKSGVKTVFIKDLFAKITIHSVSETTLGANIWSKDRSPLQWNARDKFVKNFNEFYNSDGPTEYSTENTREREDADIEKGITLAPQEIRTFVVSYTQQT